MIFIGILIGLILGSSGLWFYFALSAKAKNACPVCYRAYRKPRKKATP